MRPPWKQRHVLLGPLAVITVSILILLLLSFWFIVDSSNNFKLNAAIMKITATQRSLSQQIINSIASDNLEGEISGPPLNELTDSLVILQKTLLYGNEGFNITPLKENFILNYQQLDAGYMQFFQQVDQNISNDSSKNFVMLLNAENDYLKQLDNFNTRLTGYSNKEVRIFQLKETCILIISLLLVFFEVRFIFLPAVKKIESQNTAMREISFTQAHTLRMPLTNIQGLLSILLENKEIDAVNNQLLSLVKKQADELDVLIKANIYKSDKNFHPQKDLSISKYLNKWTDKDLHKIS